MVLSLIQLALAGSSIARSFSGPKQQFLTKVVQFKIARPYQVTRTLEIEYYTVEVDGHWVWRTWKGEIKTGEATFLVDEHGDRVHAARLVLRSWGKYGLRPDKGKEMVLLSESYLDTERQSYGIDITPGTTQYDVRVIGFHNLSDYPVQVSLKTDVGVKTWRFDVGEKALFMLNGAPISAEKEAVLSIANERTKKATTWTVYPCPEPYEAADPEEYYVKYAPEQLKVNQQKSGIYMVEQTGRDPAKYIPL
jgi:hypothetical protein